MDDLDDLVEAVVDIEDILEEVADPEELIEDFVESPLLIGLALAGALIAAVTVFLIVLTLIFFLFAVGPVIVVASLAVVGFLITVLSFIGFVYLRTDIPSDIQQKIETAMERSDNTPQENAEMTEREAIEKLKTQYAEGHIDDQELERALEDVLTSDQPERVVERHRSL